MRGIAGHSHLGSEREGRSLVYREDSRPIGPVLLLSPQQSLHVLCEDQPSKSIEPAKN